MEHWHHIVVGKLPARIPPAPAVPKRNKLIKTGALGDSLGADSQARSDLLTGKRIPAAAAFRVGLVNEVVPRAELDAAVERWVADILACAPLSVRAIKQVARRTAHLTAREAQAARLPAVVEALRSKDSEEGVRAFVEKRKPVWRGE